MLELHLIVEYCRYIHHKSCLLLRNRDQPIYQESIPESRGTNATIKNGELKWFDL